MITQSEAVESTTKPDIATERIPAAQYLRTSRDYHPQYSIENQRLQIAQYAEQHGYEVVKTYIDAGKSGVSLKGRSALIQLLQDVVNRETCYTAILVYDVSRWGRFHDTDEGAHYEFVCKLAGIPVCYCAEPALNGQNLSSFLVKAIKRGIAAEYSREVSARLSAGKRKVVSLGFRAGGTPGFGLRRMLVSSGGIPKQFLEPGQRKSAAEDRVVLVPGYFNEIRCVYEIFQMALEGRTEGAIARALNGKSYAASRKWTRESVRNILRNEKYAGSNIWGQRPNGGAIVPRSKWTIKPNAFDGLIDKRSFDCAQAIIRSRGHKTDAELLALLRPIYSVHGTISKKLISHASGLPTWSTYLRRFNGISKLRNLLESKTDPSALPTSKLHNDTSQLS